MRGRRRSSLLVLARKAPWRTFRYVCYRVQKSRWFDLLTMGVIILNAVALALYW